MDKIFAVSVKCKQLLSDCTGRFDSKIRFENESDGRFDSIRTKKNDSQVSNYIRNNDPIDIKPSICPAHGRPTSVCKISPSYDTAFSRR